MAYCIRKSPIPAIEYCRKSFFSLSPFRKCRYALSLPLIERKSQVKKSTESEPFSCHKSFIPGFFTLHKTPYSTSYPPHSPQNLHPLFQRG